MMMKMRKRRAWHRKMLVGATLAFCFVYVIGNNGAHGFKRYDNFQALGFGIYTGGAEAVLGVDSNCWCPDPRNYQCWECLVFNDDCGCEASTRTCSQAAGHYGDDPGDGTGLLCYLGRDDVALDVRGRAAVIGAAVERAYQMADPSEKTLKIFNAPEFFWRGSKGSYSFSSFVSGSGDETGNGDGNSDGALDDIAEALDAIVQQERFQDWLFVFGTIVASEEIQGADGENESLFLNVAPVYRGYDPNTSSGEGKRFLVPKRYVSGIDFLTSARIPSSSSSSQSGNYAATFQRPELYQELYDNSIWTRAADFLQRNDYALLQEGWFYVEDIAFSIEICLDHANGFAQNMYTRLRASPEGMNVVPGSSIDGGLEYRELPEHMAQISLITSSGLILKDMNLVTTSGGSVFVQDGLFPNSPVLMTCNITMLEDGYLGYKDCLIDDSDANPEARRPFRSANVFDSEYEMRDAMAGLYTLDHGFPQIHAHEPVPIVRREDQRQTEYNNNGGNRLRKRRLF